MGIIYCATFNNGKKYIGQTSNKLNQRINEHFSAARNNKKDTSIFHKAIRKYGEDNITWEILENNIDSPDLLNEKEKYYIEKFNTHFIEGNGYNMSFGGEGNTSIYKFSLKECEILLEKYKQCGSSVKLAEEYNCTGGCILTNLRRICDDSELKQFAKLGRGHTSKFSEEFKIQLYERWKELGLIVKLADEFDIDKSTVITYLNQIDPEYNNYKSISCKFTNIQVQEMWNLFLKIGDLHKVAKVYGDVHYATLINLFKKIDPQYSRYLIKNR